jgi:hypothetical protein
MAALRMCAIRINSCADARTKGLQTNARIRAIVIILCWTVCAHAHKSQRICAHTRVAHTWLISAPLPRGAPEPTQRKAKPTARTPSKKTNHQQQRSQTWLDPCSERCTVGAHVGFLGRRYHWHCCTLCRLETQASWNRSSSIGRTVAHCNRARCALAGPYA